MTKKRGSKHSGMVKVGDPNAKAMWGRCRKQVLENDSRV